MRQTYVRSAATGESAVSRQVGGDHYQGLAISPIVFAEANRLSACESLAVKYICRHRRKGGREDLEKAIHCLEMLIELTYGTASDDSPPVEDSSPVDELCRPGGWGSEDAAARDKKMAAAFAFVRGPEQHELQWSREDEAKYANTHADNPM